MAAIGVALAGAPAPRAVADHDLWPEPKVLPCSGPGHELAAERPGAEGDVPTVDVLVLIDRVPEPLNVGAVMERASAIYAGIGVTVSATFEHHDFEGRDTTRLLAQLKDSLVGTGAERYDAVLLETGVDITNTTGSIAGYATCLGGVRFKDQLQSLAIAEVGFGARSLPNASADRQLERDAMVAAHEIGHLFGARHEHGTCAEALGPEDLGADPRPCTLMAERLTLSEARFGMLEAAVIRGHARHYAAP